MCGIVGYVGARAAAPLILDGLARLEYRGYDSAGLAVIDDGALGVRRGAGKLSVLRDKVYADPLPGSPGIGHTRWATHGAAVERNAHPHISASGDFAVVHNGIVENYQELRDELRAEGVVFSSDTDTEVIAHLIERLAGQGDPTAPDAAAPEALAEATRRACALLKGAHAIVVLSRRHPDQIVAVRVGNAGGVVVGLGQGENFLASDLPAILEHTREMIFLESRQMAVVRADGVALMTLDGAPVAAQIQHVAWDPVGAAKGEYKHFMQKEIFDQPRALTDTLGGRIDFEHGRVMLPELNLSAERARALTRLVTVACGTSYYSGLAGKFYIERLARLPVEVDYASEYRYREPILDRDTAVLAITQSGETADTLAAMEIVLADSPSADARPPLWSIVNAVGSQAMRLSDGCITMHAGPEIGVASTKAFTASLIDQLLLAIYLGQLRGTLSPDAARRCTQDLARLPALVGRALEADAQVEALAGALYHYRDFLFLGRGIHYPIALEGALKLKEVSYIHAEGYPAGEMKHGPIALIDEEMPVVAIAPRDGLYDKMRSQIAQAKARGARVIAIATEGDASIAAEADDVLTIPDAPELLTPALTVIPLQLLAYHIAAWRGADVDQPRNLAKSVTVE